MADQNFTEFTAGSLAGSSYLVGYDSVANEERKYPASSLTTFTNENLPIATSSVEGIVSIGTGLIITSGQVSAAVTSVSGKTGVIVLGVADVTGAADSGANTNITNLTGLTNRPTWNLGGSVATPWDTGNLPAIGARQIGYSIVLTSSTITVPANTAFILGEAVGPGGGSGGSAGAGSGQVSVSQSGGGGTYCKFRIDSPTTTLSVVIGAAGTPGAANASGTGGTGGTSSITGYINVPGGIGGAAGAVTTFTSPYVVGAVGLSTLATGSATIIENQSGTIPGLVPVLSTSNVVSASGGNSKWGSGAPSSANGQPGTSSSQYGAGASGCALIPSSSASSGGTGGPSKFILYFFANQ